ncbi:pantoate--beta-alanine ligase [Salirhabdus euzebyi]|uniref:Pantothenate synthetase n=1 Tax=Salirhabdus euzebyi TaxID=394506 RepID=A0A841PYS3_9BACI|nr:pantoate--beta-alanine ligase [Salirhabdus euzebyi]MBB6452231.1 pantoate--beta-alanine ligase [Salirhabdus euzebyi]
MKVVHTVREMQQIALQNKQTNQTIGYVPTMGFLHDGHQRLLQSAKKENDIVVLSIFVNPLQFGPNEDFDRYPRDEEHDREIAEQEGVDIVFMPSVREMYPSSLSVQLNVNNRTNVLCGRSREGHFDGVVTVLTKLFHIVMPDKAYFGLKDAQQVAVVEGLVKDLNFPVKIMPIPTVREQDGLAKSSRNVYLSKEEREQAKYLYHALQHGQQLVKKGEKTKDIIINEVIQFINSKTRGKIDYVELLTFPNLEQVDQINERVILATAVQFERARLIDNIIFEKNGEITITSS